MCKKGEEGVVTKTGRRKKGRRTKMGWFRRLKVGVVLVGKRSGGGLVELGLVLGHEGRVDLDLGRGEGRRGDELEVRVADQLAGEPQEGSLEVVVRLCRDLEVLKVLLAVEGDGTGLNLALLLVETRSATAHSPHPTRNVEEERRRRTLTSTLLPQRTMGMFSQTRSRSRCQLGTFL
jgi:hypothetical protein